MFLRQRKSRHISRCSCTQWKLANIGNVSSRGKKRIYGVGSFQRGSHSPKGRLLTDLAMTLSIFVSSLFSYQGCVCRHRPCERYRATTAELCSTGPVFASRKRFYAIVVTPGSKPNRLIWQQPFPDSTAVSTSGTLLAELHWEGGIYFILDPG